MRHSAFRGAAVALFAAPIALTAPQALGASFQLEITGALTRDEDASDLQLPNGGSAAATFITGSFSASADTTDASTTQAFFVRGDAALGPISESVDTTGTFALDDFAAASAAFGLGAPFTDLFAGLADFFLNAALPVLAANQPSVSDDFTQDDLGAPLGTLTYGYEVTNANIDLVGPDISANFDFDVWIVQDLVGLFGGAVAPGVAIPADFTEDFAVSASIQPVPAPAALPLLGGGLALLGLMARRRAR